MKGETRKPIGYVIATVKMPLYQGDRIEERERAEEWPWFEYREPGINDKGGLAVCRRECETLKVKIERK